MKLREEKYHSMTFGSKSKDSVFAIGKSSIKENEYEKLLGVTFDKKSSFTKHAQGLCKKTNQKLHAIAWLPNYIHPIKYKTTKICIHKIAVQLLSTYMNVPRQKCQ